MALDTIFKIGKKELWEIVDSGPQKGQIARITPEDVKARFMTRPDFASMSAEDFVKNVNPGWREYGTFEELKATKPGYVFSNEPSGELAQANKDYAAFESGLGKSQPNVSYAPKTQTLASIQEAANKSANQQTNQQANWTPPQATNLNNQVYKVSIGQTGPDGKPIYNVYEAGTNRKIELPEFQQKGLNMEHINLQGATSKVSGTPAQPGAVGGQQGASGGAMGATPAPTLGTSDWEKYYGGDVAKEKAEAEAAKVAAETAYKTSKTTKENLIADSQKLFTDLWGSPDIVAAKGDKEKAFAELQRIDTEESAAKEKVKQGVTPGWAMSGQLRLITESYSVQRSTYASNYAIANDKLTEAKDYAQKAYDAGINVLNAKIGLAEDALKHAENLSATEKSEYQDVLKKAKELSDQKKSEADQVTDLYVSLASKGVGGITPNMTIAEMTRIAGPVLAKIAQDEIALNKQVKLNQINAINRDTTTDNYLNSKKGTDGYVAAGTYQEALRKFIANGGTQANFFASFPQQTYLRQQEIDKLPPALKPQITSTTKAYRLQELLTKSQNGENLDALTSAEQSELYSLLD